MWTGRQTLGSIDSTLEQLRKQFEQTDSQIQAVSRELVELRQQEGSHYSKLAGIRLDQHISGDIAEGLDAADRRVTELLAERDRALTSLNQQIEQAREQEAALEKKRQQQGDLVDEAAEELDNIEAAVQAALEQDSAYTARFEAAGKSDSVARHAEEKTAQAEADRIKKGRPYEEDPLFTYLWKRGYGTSEYSANPVIRFLDKWVSNLCSYDEARPNYSMLLEIPKRLRQHAERLRTAANWEYEVLTKMEEKAAEQGGVLGKRHALEEAEQRAEKTDTEIQEIETLIQGLLEARASFAEGRDRYFRSCIETLSAAFQRENILALHKYALTTSTAEDDEIVYGLSDLNEKKKELESSMEQHKMIYEKQLARLRELEGVRSRYKQKRYDNIHSVFQNVGLLALLLSQFLNGATSGDDLWRTLQREHRYRRLKSNPVFGSGGFGRGGMWRLPFPGGDGSMRLPIPGGGGWRHGPGRGGIGSKGGFRTGGGV
jgi:chromosome segregation ATPase